MRFGRLLAQFGSPHAVLAAPRSELKATGLSQQALDYLAQPDEAQLENDLAWLEKPDNHLVLLTDADYPPLLKQLSDKPPLLFVHGDRRVLSQTQLAIVGTRNPSSGGRQIAHDFAEYLSAVGMVITSGLALGIDTAAHKGALRGTGISIAVMGTGLDRVYPAQNKALAHQIAEQGALISEFAPGTPALAEHFPRRNRIIAGLSVGTLVVEAALKSGSLITARLAAEQGREVFAIPGSIHNAHSKGCHRLIREGAKLVETAADILEELGPLMMAGRPDAGILAKQSRESEQDAGETAEDTALTELDSEYRSLLDQIGFEGIPIDVLVERSGLTVDAVSSMLLILELQGYVSTAPGGFYARSKTSKSEIQ